MDQLIMALQGIDLRVLAGTELRKIAGTRGGEWAGPCPGCRGRDRLHVQPAGGADGRGLWMCRVCHPRWGDAIDFRRHFLGESWPEACRALGLDAGAMRGALPSQFAARPFVPPPDVVAPPPPPWQDAATCFVEACAAALWDDRGRRAREWLRGRGLAEESIRAAGLGYNPADRWDTREDWGLAPERGQPRIYLPRGIVCPWKAGARLWKINIRRPKGDPRYVTIRGSANALYGADGPAAARPAVLVEGVFDALHVTQSAGDLAPVVAAGTTGARKLPWLARLAACSAVLVGFDDDPAGEEHARWWVQALAPHARRWRPYLKDPAAMGEAGLDIRGWVGAGLEACEAASGGAVPGSGSS